MANYPSGVYSPRIKENKPGVEYDPEQSTVGFAEDVTKLDDEVIAIETELGSNPKGEHANVGARILSAEKKILPITFVNLYSKQMYDNSNNWQWIVESKIKFTAADWVNFDVWLEVIGKTDNALSPALFDLYNDTDGVQVPNSQISIDAINDTLVRCSTSLQLTIGTKTYVVRYKSQDAVYANLYMARLIFIPK